MLNQEIIYLLCNTDLPYVYYCRSMLHNMCVNKSLIILKSRVIPAYGIHGRQRDWRPTKKPVGPVLDQLYAH